MKNLLFKILMVTFISSCATTHREVIINKETGEKIIGYDKDCKYRIGKTKRSEFTDEMLVELQKDSIFLYFSYAHHPPQMKGSKRLIGGIAIGKYGPTKEIKIGDHYSKVVSIYGKPVATDVLYWEDKRHRVRWAFQGLFYEDMAVLIDTSKNNTVRGFAGVGSAFLVNKKYREKSKWYKE